MVMCRRGLMIVKGKKDRVGSQFQAPQMIRLFMLKQEVKYPGVPRYQGKMWKIIKGTGGCLRG
eukprot:276786-Karenia_brevis.AAC.1